MKINGTVIYGIEKIKDDLTKLLKLGGKMISENKYAIKFENIALLRAQFRIISPTENGENVIISGITTEVVREQKDGTWLYIIDHSFGGIGGLL